MAISAHSSLQLVAVSLLLFLLSAMSSVMVLSKTFPGDTAALLAVKRGINPGSIPAGSCLSSWDFSADPCDAAFSDRFTCGFRCDAADASGLRRVTELALDPAGYAGALSPSVWSLSYLESLDLADNRLAGPVPPPPAAGLPPGLRRLTLSRNSLSGPIPPLSPAPLLEKLYLDSNLLSGPIPASLAELRALKRVEVQANNLTGEFPDLSTLNSLQFLDASDNALSGGFPRGLPPSLVEVSMRNNRLVGGLADAAVAALPALQVMDLSGNALWGAVPGAAFEHPSLEQLNLGGNRFESVEAPGAGGAGSRLIALELARNRLGGPLPAFLGLLPRLSAVSLEHNRFTGMIPAVYAVRAAEGVEGVAPFERLLLDGNYLFGPVPSALGVMKEGSAMVSLDDNCLFRCPPEFFVCRGSGQKPSATCRQFNPFIP